MNFTFSHLTPNMTEASTCENIILIAESITYVPLSSSLPPPHINLCQLFFSQNLFRETKNAHLLYGS